MHERLGNQPGLEELYLQPVGTAADYAALEYALANTPQPKIFEDIDWQERYELRIESGQRLLEFAHTHRLNPEVHIKRLVNDYRSLRDDQFSYAELHHDANMAYEGLDTAIEMAQLTAQYPQLYLPQDYEAKVIDSVVRAVALEHRYWMAIPYARRVIDVLANLDLNQDSHLDAVSRALYERANELYDSKNVNTLRKSLLYFEAVQYLGPSKQDCEFEDIWPYTRGDGSIRSAIEHVRNKMRNSGV